MLSKYQIIIFLSLILLSFSQDKHHNLQKNSWHQYLKKLQCAKDSQVNDNRMLIQAMSSGFCDKKQVRSQLQLFQKYNLMHLFTPSGLHLSFLGWLIWQLIPSSIAVFLWLIIGLSSYQLHLLAIARISLIQLIKNASLLTQWKFNPFSLFLLAFTLDFFIGTYHVSHLSFFYSFLFLGSLYAAVDKGEKKYFFLYLLYSQFFLAIITQQVFYPIHSLLGLILSSIFSLIFPLFLFSALTQTLWSLSEWPIQIMTELLEFTDHYFTHFNFSTSPYLLIFYFFPHWIKNKFILFILIFHLQAAGPIDKSYPHSLSVIRKANEGVYCLKEFYRDFWWQRCYGSEYFYHRAKAKLK